MTTTTDYLNKMLAEVVLLSQMRDALTDPAVRHVADLALGLAAVVKEYLTTGAGKDGAPPKREPRDVWVNVYPNFPFSIYPKSREEADEIAHSTRIECIHFREVIEEAATEPDEEKLPERFNLTETKLALHDHMLVEYAFTWSSTPQGSEFWGSYSANTLSSEDTARAREALRRWIAIAERRAAK